jgi:hypothetical protein
VPRDFVLIVSEAWVAILRHPDFDVCVPCPWSEHLLLNNFVICEDHKRKTERLHGKLQCASAFLVFK